jgi:lysophospholipase L1-like esterase
MKKNYTFICLLIVVLFSSAQLHGWSYNLHPQDTLNKNRFLSEIEVFKQEDIQNPIPKGAIIFTGSSSIRLWKSLQADMQPMKVYNRGFGGSTLAEVYHFADDLIVKHQPKAVVLYAGENDLQMLHNDNFAVSKVVDDFENLISYLQVKIPEARIYYISIKYSPSRDAIAKLLVQANAQIAAICAKNSKLHFIDITEPMKKQSANNRDALYVEDRLHLNEKGYEIWAKTVRKTLLRKEGRP